MNTLPFNIDWVVEQDLVPLGISKIPTSTGYNINCPFCEAKGLKPDTKHKYSVNIYKNVGNCLRCKSGHGIISLHQQLSNKPITLEEARNDLFKRWNGLPSDVKVELSKVQERLEEENAKMLIPAPIVYRDAIYRNLLNSLSLSDRHKKDLIRRGLTEEEIEKGMYKTVPSVGFKTYAAKSFYRCDCELTHEFCKHSNWGIPGYFNVHNYEPELVRCSSGYFVPVKNEDGLISGMQIRYDPLPEDATEHQKQVYAKYKWFNSNYKGKKDGCTASGCENIHYACNLKGEKNIILTEGVLKADIASIIYSRLKGLDKPSPVMGLVGVYNTDHLAEELTKLKQSGLEKVWIAVDMDYRTKPQVAEAMNRIKEIIESVGVEYEVWTWNDAYKGIDDWLQHLYSERTKQ